MTTLFITHPECLGHIASEKDHPERPDRLRAIEKALRHEMFTGLKRGEAPIGQIADIARAHPLSFIEDIRKRAPTEGIVNVDYQGETLMSPETWPAMLRAAGASVEAVDQVMTGAVHNAFCSIRPPGHHAEPGHAMGFCFFNNAAIAALHARSVFGVERIAIVDFDVHHGNGTQSIFWSDKNLFYASSHQDRLYPFSGGADEKGCAGNIVNTPLRAGAEGDEFRDAYRSTILPALHNFAPDLLIISAGFDAHRDDPLGELGLVEDDYRWVTEKLLGVASAHAKGRVVSVLEGGYDLTSLARSAAIHIRTLMEFGT